MIRIFGPRDGDPHTVRVRVKIRAPDGAPARFRLVTPTAVEAGRLLAGEEKRIAFSACVPARSPLDLTLTAWSNARIAGVQLGPTVETTRPVGVLVGPISVTESSRACRPPTRR
jgi:hypothetical protein